MPQGIDTPGVEALTWGDETPGVDTEGNGVMGEEDSMADDVNDGMARGLKTALPPHPGSMVEDKYSAGPCRSNLTAPTASGPKTACTHAASSTYCCWRIRREVKPTQGLEKRETATGLPERWRKRGERRRQRRQRLGSVRS